MSLRVDWVTIDANDTLLVARFWEQALTDYELHQDEEEDDDEYLLMHKDRKGPKLLIEKVPEGKTVKNRIHLDLRPEIGGNKDAEVARLEALGATKIDIGQGDVSWTVMADPEGNEFCVLRAFSEEEAKKYEKWAW